MTSDLGREASRALDLRANLFRLGLLNNVGALVALLTGVLMVPIMLAGLGSESYGAWIMVIAANGLVISLDFGLGHIVTREIARANSGAAGDSSPVALAAGGAQVVIGICGAVALAAIGLAADYVFDGGAAHAGVLVFTLVGTALLAERLIQYTFAVFSAHLRYGLVNLIASASTLLRAALVILALAIHPGLQGVASAFAFATVSTAICAVYVLGRVDPAHALGSVKLDWRALRPQVRFGVASMLATLAGAMLWQIHPLLIGAIAGPAAVAAFFVGIRLPLLVCEMNSRAAEVLFPAVSGASSRVPDAQHPAIALSTGLRWLTLLALPLAVMGCILAPAVLDAWLLEVPVGAASVLRTGVVIMLLSAWTVPAMQVLWGLGQASRLAYATTGAAIVAVVLELALLPSLGALAASIALIARLAILATWTLREAKRHTGLGHGRVFTREIVRLLPAGAACTVGTLVGQWAAGGTGSLIQLMSGAGLGTSGYVMTLFFSGSLAEEQAILRRALGPIRERAKGIRPLRSAWYMMLVLRERIAYRQASTVAGLDALFAARPDPWDYDSSAEQERHVIAEKLVERIDDPRALDRVIEIGCAEGVFTERLAPRCRSLLSLDVSAAAIERARGRRDWAHSVRFARFDLTADPMPGKCSLVVVMDVLTYFQSVTELRAIRGKIVDAIEPGGWLLVGDVRQRDVYESSWWGKRLLCGGYWICDFMARHEQLTVVAQAQTDTHVFRLLRKSA